MTLRADQTGLHEKSERESVLHAKAREAILSGQLPAKGPDRTILSGAGSGAACSVCGESVEREQIGLEVEFKRHEPGKYSLHTRCFSAWERECAAVQQRKMPDRRAV
jgi:hypothetical protein